jgi:hypothetical protein
VEACEVDKTEEVFDVVFPSGDETAEIVHPDEEPFYFPAPLEASQLAPAELLRAPPE